MKHKTVGRNRQQLTDEDIKSRRLQKQQMTARIPTAVQNSALGNTESPARWTSKLDEVTVLKI